MKNVLVICTDVDACRLIESKFGKTDRVRIISDISTFASADEKPFDLVFMDVTMQAGGSLDLLQEISRNIRRSTPLSQIIALAPKESVRKAVTAVRKWANDYLTYPIDGAEIDLVLESIHENRSKNLELEYLRDKFWKSEWIEIIQTNNLVMRSVLDNVRSVAPTIATVLLLGETGTGKGLMARLLHQHSHRSEGPFVSVHCGAIPDTLIESELFGHEKGSFTGADRKKIGKFEIAYNGTIFLDEIGTLTASAQVKLLQVLQDGTFSRVGGADTIHTNARIIAATNSDLNEMAESGTFRKDLYYRLNVFPIEIIPLKKRKEDLPHFINLFIGNLNNKYGKNINDIDDDVMKALQAYSWPGNLRELENVLERAYILEKGETLRPVSFPGTLIIDSKIVQAINETSVLPLAEARQIAIDEFERTYLSTLLRKYKGKVNVSAKEADITTRQFSRLAAKHGLDKTKYKT
jgi:DNA-binding NtrC family response regulator